MNNNGETPFWISHYICLSVSNFLFIFLFGFNVFFSPITPHLFLCSSFPYLVFIIYLSLKCKSLNCSLSHIACPRLRNANNAWFLLCSLQVIIFSPYCPANYDVALFYRRGKIYVQTAAVWFRYIRAIKTVLMNSLVFQHNCQINLPYAHVPRHHIERLVSKSGCSGNLVDCALQSYRLHTCV